MKLYFTKVIFTAFLIFITLCGNAQEKSPLLSGTVKISILEGTFECDLTISDIPRIRDYYILLNSGMNIMNFKNLASDKLFYYEKATKAGVSYESSAYYFPDNTGKQKFLPTQFQMKYVGKYPVMKDTIGDNYSVHDWKGNIAFNGYSVRTDGMQAAWYPIIYDIEKDKKYTAVRYDIEVTCNDCSTLFINGSKAVETTKHTFKSEVPQELTMFMGKYKTTNVKGTYILNPDINEEQIQIFGNLMNGFKKYFEQKLNIPYKQEITFVQTTPVSKSNSWLFVTYPTIMIIGHGERGLKAMFNEKDGNFYKPFLAHELGHYYFGFYKSFNAALGDMMSEGFSEFMALKASKDLISPELYNKKLEQKFNELKDFQAVPFSKVASKDDYKNRNNYVYNYAPIIFFAIEKKIGEQKMWQWLKKILETPATFTDYNFLLTSLKEIVKNDQQLEQIRTLYFESDHSLDNAVKILQ